MHIRRFKEDRAYKWKGLNFGWFYQRTYYATINILLPATADDVNAWAEKHYGFAICKPGHLTGRTLYYEEPETGQNFFVLAFGDWAWKPGDLANLAHELMHVTLDIANTRSIEISADPDAKNEAACYLHGELYQRSVELIHQMTPFPQ